ncbi:hypothetical protein KIPE111705_21855 [Kibdelosporangium persicum]|uniref:L-tyrosine 3-hydroxylase n=1 Tax=Kibdelosporangium persicum TaxID=2698649 RepID=A0ABX2FDF5_9PSEU|nr:hypothetical protein [Kibdelosporangium persicum]NRN69401.1 L-tyrosine 3-hydroxylase [Kibdelosporangium persicum]
MTREVGLVLTRPPSGVDWDFGGYCYGVEPLTLPMPGAPDRPETEPSADLRAACEQIRAIGESGVPEGLIERCQDEGELYWFRWITGHQISFAVWRLMSQLLDDVTEGRTDAATATRPLCSYVRTYCAMLLYAGSCPIDVYREVIRPSMRLQHRSFSGSWAPDYWPVRNLLRARPSPFSRFPELAEEIRLHQVVHDHVAANLVPDGKSLLRQSSVRRQDMRLLHLFYDNYFLTMRAPVSRTTVVAQLIRRMVAIAQDVAVNSLHPGGAAGSGQRADEVVACENGITEILAQAAHHAAGSAPRSRPGVRSVSLSRS